MQTAHADPGASCSAAHTDSISFRATLKYFSDTRRLRRKKPQVFRDWLAKYDGKVMNIPLPTLVHRMESLSSWKADMLKARKKEDVENFLDSDFDLTVSAGQLSASSDPEGECLFCHSHL